MPDKKQYDDELVQLLGRGELADREIAERLGLSPSQVSRIARGEKRPDLQPRICAAMRRNLKEAWKNGGHLDGLGTGRLDTRLRPPWRSDCAQPAPGARPAPGTAQTAFDRHLAVELIASGQLTLSQIAERLGVHKTTVSRIIAGRSHPELQGLIREAERHYRDRARRIGVKWSAQIVMKQIQVGLKDNGWVGLRARQDLLDRFLGPEDERVEKEVPPAERDFGPELRDLPEPLKTEVIRALGGPTGEDDPYGDAHWAQPPPGLAPGAPAAAQEDAGKEQAAAALQKNDAASRSRCPPKSRRDFRPDCVGTPASGSGPSAEPFDRLDKLGTGAAPATADLRQGKPSPATADLRQGKQEETSTTEEGCSRNKKRRQRRRRMLHRRTI